MSKRTVFIGLLTVNINNNTVPNNIQRLAENRFLNLLPENQLKIISTLNIPTITPRFHIKCNTLSELIAF